MKNDRADSLRNLRNFGVGEVRRTCATFFFFTMKLKIKIYNYKSVFYFPFSHMKVVTVCSFAPTTYKL